MTVRLTDNGVKFDSTSRVVGKFESPMIGAFLLGEMYGVVSGDGTRIWFLRPVADLAESERHELADYQISAWQRFKDR